MPIIDSPQFKRSTIPSKSVREFAPVGDPNDLDTSQHNQSFQQEVDYDSLKEARKIKLNPPITPSAKKRLEFLADIGKLTKEVELSGITFTLRTLKSKELREAYVAMSKQNTQVEAAIEYRRYCLAFSITNVDHQDLETMLNIQSLNDRIDLIDNLEENIVEVLFQHYNLLADSSNKQFAIKTDADVKEVAEDLKK